MAYPPKNGSELIACLVTALLVFTILSRYGKQVMEWILMKLYEFFIQKNPMDL
jgi:hypothetical protein